MMKILQAKWFAITLGTLVYAGTTWWFLQPQKQLLNAARSLRAAATKQIEQVGGPSWTFMNPELNQLATDLKDEREALRRRSSQLDELEARLTIERQEISAVTQTVARLRKELDQSVIRVTEEEAVNLRKLGKVYATMSPPGAAHILKEMDDDQLVKILALMKEAETAPILEAFGALDAQQAKRAALISNRLRLTLAPKKAGAAP
jgi:flagellar motility protein MotE (MotC chaperone)